MKAVFAPVLALGGLLAVAGCATPDPGTRPVQVTSFHLGQPLARGSIAIESFDVPDRGGPEFGAFADAVARQLGRLGWNLTGAPGQSEQVALVGIERSDFEGPPRHSPVMIGIGGGTGGWNGGVGAGASFPVGGSRASHMVGTTLQVRIKRRSDQSVIWEGHASAAALANSPQAQTNVMAERLADALFRYFPGESGRTISVK